MIRERASEKLGRASAYGSKRENQKAFYDLIFKVPPAHLLHIVFIRKKSLSPR